MVTYKDALHDDLFVDRMSKFSPREIVRAAKELNNGSLGYAEAMLALYNKKMRYPLQRRKLYDEGGDRAPEETEKEPDSVDGSLRDVAESGFSPGNT